MKAQLDVAMTIKFILAAIVAATILIFVMSKLRIV